MDINVKISKGNTFQAFYMFFIIPTVQLGVGIMGAPRYIFIHAKQDSWLSILIAGIVMIVVISVMLLILKQYDNSDILGIQVDVFGKWLGSLLGILYIAYFFAANTIILMNYIEVIQVFLYPTLPSYAIGFLMLFLIVYALNGGMRTIVGMALLFFLLTQVLSFLLYKPIAQMDWYHFLPMFQSSPVDVLKGAKATTFTVLGLEILFFLYPFVGDKERLKRPLYLGICFTTFIVLLLTCIAIGYYGLENLPNLEWSVLTLYKSVSFSFIDRLDYIVIIMWIMVVIPANVFLLWAMSNGLKRLFGFREKVVMYVIALITLVIVTFVNSDASIMFLTDLLAKIGFWIVFVYPFVLLPCVYLKKYIKKRKQQGKQSNKGGFDHA